MALSDVLGSALPAAGFLLGGPAGAAVGAFAGGLAQNSAANRKMGEWNQLDRAIPLNDPAQQSYLGRLERQERQYRAGADPSTALANRMAQQAGAQTQSNLVRSGGPGIVQNLLSSQNVTQRNLAQAGALAAQGADRMLGMQGDLTNMMAQRRYDRQRYRRDLALMQGQQMRQDANNQMMSAVSMLPGIAGEGYKGLLGKKPINPGSYGGGGGLGNAWRTQGTGGNMPAPMTTPAQYAMLPGSVQAPTSAYDMGQQVNI